MREKQNIKKEVTDLTYDLEGPLEVVISRLQELADQYPVAEISREDRGYDDEYRYYLDEIRLETDLEFTRRLAREKEFAARQVAYKKAQLERLKKELGES